MKSQVTRVLVWLLLIPIANANAVDTADSLVRSSGAVAARISKKDLVYLAIYRRGSIHFFHKTPVMGSVVFEESGFRFVPATTAPEVFGDNEEAFKKQYWYNSLFKDLFVAYSDVRVIKAKGKIELKDGTKYIMWGRTERWAEIQREVQSKLTK